MDARQQLFIRLLRRGLRVAVPVDVGEAPEHGAIAETFRHFQVFFAVDALRRPVIGQHLLARGLTILVGDALQFAREGLQVGDLRHIIMMPRVVADDVPLLRHPPHQLWIVFDVRPDDEERRLDVMLFQNVQNLFRVSGFIARVERQIDHLFLGVPDVDRVILAQRARRRVADRRLPLRAEAEAPRPGRHRRRGEHHRQHRAERQHGPQRQQNPRIFPAEPFDLFHNQAPPPQPMRRLPFLGRFFRCAAFCRRFAENGRVLQTKSAHPCTFSPKYTNPQKQHLRNC